MWSLIYNLVGESSTNYQTVKTSEMKYLLWYHQRKLQRLKDSVSGNLVKVGRSGKEGLTEVLILNLRTEASGSEREDGQHYSKQKTNLRITVRF